ncbi:MAG: toxin [Epsilonproteobacteria bacterium]|nr:toxin [Campylobacterota bacterium]
MSKIIHWNEEKNQLLQIQRKLSFEMVVEKISNQEILSRRSHPDVKRYPNQYIFVLELNGYICYVPFVESDEEIFLKTIIPSRKLNKEFKGKNDGK